MPGTTEDDVPTLAGRTALVTGATSGVGRRVAEGLVRRGTRTLLACRDVDAAAVVAAQLRAATPGARVEVVHLDLADLRSVSAAVDDVAAVLDAPGATGLDVLVNNAGVMAVPHREVTAQGHELQLGVNHLGHVALTAGLLPQLRRRPGARVVTVTSSVHHRAQLALDDLESERRYRAWAAYGQSKLANVLFAVELQRRSDAGGWGLLSTSAHPGLCRTRLARGGPLQGGVQPLAPIVLVGTAILGQSDRQGARPVLHAATAADVVGGGCYGPRWLFGWRGPPGPVTPSRWALDEQLAAWLWTRSEELTGVAFPAVSAP